MTRTIDAQAQGAAEQQHAATCPCRADIADDTRSADGTHTVTFTCGALIATTEGRTWATTPACTHPDCTARLDPDGTVRGAHPTPDRRRHDHTFTRVCAACLTLPAAPGDRYCDGCGSAADREAWADQ